MSIEVENCTITDTAKDNYQRGLKDAILWLVENNSTYKPIYLAEQMLLELLKGGKP